jgi:hypothetical protein
MKALTMFGRTRKMTSTSSVLGITCSAITLLSLSSGDARAQEFSLFGGGSRAELTNTYSWAFNYQEGLGVYFAASFMWLNEGYIPDHHRDEQAIQFWGRLSLANRRLVPSAGVGPYRYLDTTTADQGGSYSDIGLNQERCYTVAVRFSSQFPRMKD